MITIFASPEEMGTLPKALGNWTGVTCTNGREKKYAAWVNGLIISYFGKEQDAMTAIRKDQKRYVSG